MGIKNIAKMANVSISTVSRVLNGTKAVSPELEQRVREIIEKEDYVPNHSARSMVLKKTNLIGLLFPRVSGFFHQKLFYSLEAILEKSGYKLIVCNIKDNDTSEISYLNILRQKEVDGIILCHESHSKRINDYLNKSKIPIVQCTINIPELKWPAINTDAQKAAKEGIEFLIKKGHRKIGMISAESYNSADLQIKGYVEAYTEHNLELSPDYIIPGEFSLSSGENITEKLLSSHPEITAIFYVSDEMAIGGYKALARMGLVAGKDIDILGHDGIELGQYIQPSLTTISQPIEEITVKTAESLFSLINSEEIDDNSLSSLSQTIPFKIIEGESCNMIKKTH